MRHATVAPTGSIPGVIHQPVEDYLPAVVAPATGTPAPTTFAYPGPTPRLEPAEFTGPVGPAGQPIVVVQAAAPVIEQHSVGAAAATGIVKLLLGVGIGAGVVVGFAIAGPLLLATVQAIAAALIATGACAVALAVAAAMVMKSFRASTPTAAPTKKGRR